MANRPLPGYPQPVGAKYEMVFDHDGPASYNNTGVTLTSGETINASDVGFGGIEYAEADGVSSDGLNYCYIMYLNQSTSGSGNALPSFVVRWFVLATGAEVANAVNLSTKSIRIRLRMI
jgi:hypothetical protein